MSNIKTGEIYTNNSGKLHSSKYKLSFTIPFNCSGELIDGDHIFVIKSNDIFLECSMYLHKPTDILLTDWLNEEAYEIGIHRLLPAEFFRPNKYISIKRYVGERYVAHKINFDVSGWGFSAIVRGLLDNEKALREFVDDLLETVRTPPPSGTVKPVSSSPPNSSLKYSQCGMCAGSGSVTCSSCNGYGYHTRNHCRTAWDGKVEYVNEQISCSSCSGGQAICSSCGGSGRQPSYG